MLAWTFKPSFLTVMIRPLLPVLAALLLSGCMAYRLTDFTDQFRRTDYQLSDQELFRMQFFLSHGLILTAVDEVRGDPTGRLFRKPVLDTRYINQVVIRRNTRGVVVAAGDRWLDVSFQEGAWLRFTLMPSGRYLLDPGMVTYGDRLYHVECVPRLSNDCQASLLVRKNLYPRIIVQSQKAKGIRP